MSHLENADLLITSLETGPTPASAQWAASSMQSEYWETLSGQSLLPSHLADFWSPSVTAITLAASGSLLAICCTAVGTNSWEKLQTFVTSFTAHSFLLPSGWPFCWRLLPLPSNTPRTARASFLSVLLLPDNFGPLFCILSTRRKSERNKQVC